jgi:hypothetical protein
LAVSSPGAVQVTEQKFDTKTGPVTVVTVKNDVKTWTLRFDGAGVGFGPNSVNWYTGPDAEEVWVGKAQGSKSSPAFAVTARGPEAGGAEMSWAFPEGAARLRFELRDQEDALRITLEGPKSVARVLRLRCYPSSFAGGWKDGAEVRERRLITPTMDQKIEKGMAMKKDLTAGDTWVLYLDDHFDVAKTGNKAEGPCALAFDASTFEAGQVTGSGYNYDTTLSTKAGSERLRVAIWDFQGLTNAEAQERVKRIVPEVLWAAQTK